ncbi:MAG: hypothetical protein QF731_10970, partial [Verrucomicrobiota bacterium]|nr:hypothetical protein [Verrucomicrobiota bacterium]
FRLKFQDIYFKNKYIDQSKLGEINYIFFPLHAEPEIALSIFSKYYQNQIELIRNIALALPMNYRLIVKEHPRNIGRRSNNYYKNHAMFLIFLFLYFKIDENLSPLLCYTL